MPLRKAYLRAFIDEVVVDQDKIHIRGRKDVLEKAVSADNSALLVPNASVRS